MKKQRSSERGWDILFKLVKDRAHYHEPDGDLTEDEKAEELMAAGEAAKRLLKDTAFQQLRLQGLEAVVQSFVSWLELDPAGPHYEKELIGLHTQASARYFELFRPEMLIKEAKEARLKRDIEEEQDHGGIRGNRRSRR